MQSTLSRQTLQRIDRIYGLLSPKAKLLDNRDVENMIQAVAELWEKDGEIALKVETNLVGLLEYIAEFR